MAFCAVRDLCLEHNLALVTLRFCNNKECLLMLFHLLMIQTGKSKMPREQAGTKDSCCRGLEEHQHSASGNVCRLQASGCNSPKKGFTIKF